MNIKLPNIFGNSNKGVSETVSVIRIDPRILTAKKIKQEILSFFNDESAKIGHPISIVAGERVYDIYVTDPASGAPSDIKWKIALQRNGEPVEQTHKLVLYDGRLPEYSIATVIPQDSRNKAWSRLTRVGIPENAEISTEPDLTMLTIIVSDLQNARLTMLQSKKPQQGTS
jgi:hypothetical protein